MGDTGSLTIGGIIAVLAIAVRKELLIPLLWDILSRKLICCTTSKLFQIYEETFWRRPKNFLMSPLHHHYQRKDIMKVKL
jgi:phospho-N-acetylmuramoyl-pentapeptide-transferase